MEDVIEEVEEEPEEEFEEEPRRRIRREREPAQIVTENQLLNAKMDHIIKIIERDYN